MSTKVIDIFNNLHFTSDYNNNGLTSGSDLVTINSYGVLTLNSTQDSSNSTTGSIVIPNGSVAINGNVNATDTDNGGTLTVGGGGAFSQDVYIGGNLNISGTIISNASVQGSNSFNYLTLTATDNSINLSTGSLVTNGGISIQAAGNATSTTSGGGITIAGGAAIKKDVYVGGIANLPNIISTNISSSNSNLGNITSSTLNVTGGITTGNALITSGTITNLLVTNDLKATFNSNTIGSIFTTGGNVGINTTVPGYLLDINGNLRVNSNSLNIISASTLTDVLQIQNTSASGASTLQFLNNSGSSRASFGIGNSSNTEFQNTVYLSTITGIPINFSAGGNTSYPVIINSADNSLSITSTTTSNSVSSGALKVSGGAGINGNLYVGGGLYINSQLAATITNTTISSNSSTGAVLLSGGLSINILSTTNANATSYTSGGALTINGGAAISQNVYISGIIDIASGSNNLNNISLQSFQFYSNSGNGTYSVIGSGNATRTATSFTPIRFTGWNDQTNPKLTINTNTIDVFNAINATNNTNTIGNIFTTGGNVGINTTTPNFNLDVSGTARFTSSITTSSIYSTNITSTNIVGTNISTNTLNLSTFNASTSISSAALYSVNTTSTNVVGTNISTNTLQATTSTIPNIVHTNISSSTLNLSTLNASTSISSAALYSVNVTSTNIVGTNISSSILITSIGLTTGTILATNTLNANFNSNTLGNIYTTGGNIGINTITPAFKLDIAGSTRINSSGNLFVGNDSSFDNIGLFVDGSNNGNGYRLGLIKKSGSGPFFGISNNHDFTFRVANNSNASLVSTNTYSTIMTLTNTGNLTVNNTINSVSLSTGNIFTSDLVLPTYISYTGAFTGFSTNVTGANSRFSIINSVNNTASNLIQLYMLGAPLQGNQSYLTILSSYGSMYSISSAFSGVGDNYPIAISHNHIPYLTVQTNGNVGIGTTTPGFTLDVVGTLNSTALYSVNATSTNIVGTNISTSTLQATTSTIPNIVHTNISTSTLQATTSTIPNIIHTNISSSTLNLSTLNASTSISSAALYSVNATSTNIVGTNISTSTLQATTSTIPNIVHTNISTSTLQATTSTIPNIVHTNISTSTLQATTSTIPNIVHTNISTSTLNISGGLTTGTLLATTSISTGLLNSTDITGTNLSSGTISGVSSTIPHMVGTNISSGTISATSSTIGSAVFTNISTNSLNVPTLGITNFTSTNIVGTNLSSGTISATSSTIDSAVFTNISTNSLNVPTLGITNFTSTNIVGTNLSSGTISATSSTITNITVSNISLNDNSSINIDAVGNGRLAFVKKSGGGPSIAISNIDNEPLIFQVANNTDASAVTTNTYTTIMTLTSTGNLSVANMVSTNISSGTINSTNITSTNFVGTNISSGTINSTNITSTNFVGTNISSGTINLSGNMNITGTLSVTNITTINLMDTNITAGIANITTKLAAIGNSNTLGNIFTTGGNTGINTSNPSTILHVARNGITDIIPTTGLGGSTVFSFMTNETTGTPQYGLISGVLSSSGLTWLQSKYSGTTGNLGLSLNPLGGNVGINNTNPIFASDILGTARVSNKIHVGTNNITSIGSLVNANNNIAQLYIYSGNTDITPWQVNNNSGVLTFIKYGSTPSVYFDSNANVSAGSLSLNGPNGSMSGPHINIKTSSDVYPLLQSLNYTHDNISVAFDGYFDGTSWKSSHNSGSFQIYKFGSRFSISYAVANAGVNITWTEALGVSNTGDVNITKLTTSNIVGTNISTSTLQATTSTIPNIVHTNISSSTLNLSTLNASTSISSAALYSINATSTNIVGTNISSSTLQATTSTIPNIVHTNISSSTLNLSTLNASTSISSAALYSINVTSTNIVGTNISTSTLVIPTYISYSGSFTGFSTQVTGANSRFSIINTVNSTASNQIQLYMLGAPGVGNQSALTILSSYGSMYSISSILAGAGDNYPIAISHNHIPYLTVQTNGNVGIGTTTPAFTLDIAGTVRITTGLTTSTLLATTSISTGTLNSTNTTTVNLVSTNVSSGTVLATSSTITNSVFTNISTSSLSVPTLGITNFTSTNIVGTNSTLTNLVLTSGSFGNLSIGNISISGNITVGGNLLVNGTLTSVNITSVNMIDTNISAGTLNATNITSTNLVANFTSLGNLISTTGTFANKVGSSQTVGTILVTTSASLIGNTNTIGSIFTTGGNVGINTTTPAFNLDVNGNVRTSALYVGNTSGINGASGLNIFSASDNNPWQIVNGTTGILDFNKFGTAGVISFLASGGISTGSINVSNIFSTNVTSTNIVATNISTSTLQASTSTIPNIVHTNISTSTLQATTSTIPNIVHTNISSSTLNLSTLNASTSISSAALYSVDATSTNIVGTNISSSTLNLSTLNASTSISSAALYSVDATSTNIVGTNISSSTLNLSTLNASTSISSAALYSVDATSTNIVGTNISSGTINLSTLNASTSISSAALYSVDATSTNIVGTNISTSTLQATTSTIPNIVATNISTGTLNATNITVINNTLTNLVLTSGSFGNLSIGNVSISGNITVGGNLLVNGTLTSVNITSVNMIDTNISAGTLNATNITSTNIVATNVSSTNLISTTGTFANKVGGSQTVGSILVTTSASLIGNTNTIGSIFTTGGNVGINTTAPSYKFHLNGPNNSLSGPHIYATNDNNIYPIFQQLNWDRDNLGMSFDMYYDGAWRTSSTSSGFQIYKLENRLNFNVHNNSAGSTIPGGTLNTVMAIGSTGNIGIKTTSPSFTLDVSGTARFTSGVTAQTLLVTSNISTGVLNSTTSTIPNIVHTNISTSTLVIPTYISYSGSFTGFSTQVTGANSRFSIINTVNSTASNQIQLYMVGVPGGGTQSALTILSSYGSMYSISSVISGGGAYYPIAISHNNIPYLTVQTNGNVGIGTTTPGFTLDVSGTARITNGLITTFNSNTLGNIFTTGGNVGIATTSPGFTLDVTGSGRFTGSLSKGSGTFCIEHPLKNIKEEKLIHSFIEGPRCDLIYRGTVKLINGIATVNIDKDCTEDIECSMTEGTFESLCINPVKYLHNNDTFDRIKGSIEGNILTIICENNTSNSSIDWVVIAERKDKFIKAWERTNNNGYLITEYRQ